MIISKDICIDEAKVSMMTINSRLDELVTLNIHFDNLKTETVVLIPKIANNILNNFNDYISSKG